MAFEPNSALQICMQQPMLPPETCRQTLLAIDDCCGPQNEACSQTHELVRAESSSVVTSLQGRVARACAANAQNSVYRARSIEC